mgnify:CR=1 FL=1
MAGGILSMIGGVFSAGGQVIGAKAQSDILETQAALTEAKSKIESARTRRAALKLISSQQAEFAKGGVLLEGTPTEVMAETAGEAEFEARMIEKFGAMEAESRRKEAAATMTAGAIGSVGTVLGSGSQAAGSFGGR